MIRKVDEYFIAENAVVIGDVTIGVETNIWPFACIRGDVAAISIGKHCSIQDHTMLHCKSHVSLEIADSVVIGHHACVHCSYVGEFSLIGIGATVLDDSRVGNHCIVAAGAVVRPNTTVPDGHLIAGVPAKIIRTITNKERNYIQTVCKRYIRLAVDHSEGKFNVAPRGAL